LAVTSPSQRPTVTAMVASAVTSPTSHGTWAIPIPLARRSPIQATDWSGAITIIPRAFPSTMSSSDAGDTRSSSKVPCSISSVSESTATEPLMNAGRNNNSGIKIVWVKVNRPPSASGGRSTTSKSRNAARSVRSIRSVSTNSSWS